MTKLNKIDENCDI